MNKYNFPIGGHFRDLNKSSVSRRLNDSIDRFHNPSIKVAMKNPLITESAHNLFNKIINGANPKLKFLNTNNKFQNLNLGDNSVAFDYEWKKNLFKDINKSTPRIINTPLITKEEFMDRFKNTDTSKLKFDPFKNSPINNPSIIEEMNMMKKFNSRFKK
jgi:hypothetical protein